MTFQDLLAKLGSRKFWALIAGLAISALVLFGVDSDTITKVAALITALGSIAAYIITEGKIDAAAVDTTVIISEPEKPE